MKHRFVLVMLLASLLLALGTGCQSRGTVTGKVTHKGKPVIWGTVTLIASDNMAYPGQITMDGNYTVANVPDGPVKIGVSSPNPDGTNRGGPAANQGGAGDRGGADPTPAIKAGKWFPLPEAYSDPLKSGLTGTVKGNTVINVELP